MITLHKPYLSTIKHAKLPDTSTIKSLKELTALLRGFTKAHSSSNREGAHSFHKFQTRTIIKFSTITIQVTAVSTSPPHYKRLIAEYTAKLKDFRHLTLGEHS